MGQDTIRKHVICLESVQCNIINYLYTQYILILQHILICNVMSIHFPSTAVVDGGESVPTSFPKPTSDSRNNHGLILGVCLGLFSWYVSSVSNIAVHFYWFLPVIAAGNVYFTCTMIYCI